VAIAPGDRFLLRRGGAGSAAIVGGVVLDAMPARGVSRRRQTTDRVAALAAAIHADDGAAAAALLELRGAVRSSAGVVSLAPDVGGAVAQAVFDAVASDPTFTAARTAAARALRRLVTLDRLATADAARSVVDELVVTGRLEAHGTSLRLAGTSPAAGASDPAIEAAKDRLVRTLATASPPPLTDAARAAGCPPAAVRDLERDGRIVVLEPDLAYAASAYRELEATALAHAAAAPLTPAALRDATGTSRKYVMAILADLDRRGMLRRTPDGHVPGPRAPLAGRSA
jgi:hypothetical protein